MIIYIQKNIQNPIFKLTIYCTKYINNCQTTFEQFETKKKKETDKLKTFKLLLCILYNLHNLYFIYFVYFVFCVAFAFFVYFVFIYTLTRVGQLMPAYGEHERAVSWH